MKLGKALIILMALLFTLPLFADDVPRIMNYQGKLTDADGVALAGSHSIIFYILKNYDPSTDAADDTLWAETLSVTITNGLFDVTLGDVHPINLDFSVPYYMELVVDGETMSPREKLAPVSYAFRSIYADTAAYAPGGGGGVNSVGAGNGLSNSGTATDPVLDVNTGTGLTISSDNVQLATTGVTPGSYTNTNLTVDSYGRITAASNGSGGGISGSGTSNYVPLWTSATNLGNSVIQQNSGNIGIGINPSWKLHVNGTGYFNGGVTISSGASTALDAVSTNGNWALRAWDSGAGRAINALNSTSSFPAIEAKNQNSSGTGIIAYGNNTSSSPPAGGVGLYAASTNYAVYAQGGNYGVQGVGTTTGVYGEGGTYGIQGVGTSYGVYGYASSGLAGWFNGDVKVSGGLEVTTSGAANIEIRSTGGSTPFIDFSNDGSIDYDGRFILLSDNNIQVQGADFTIQAGYTKSCIMPTSDGDRRLYVMESPEVWFEDFGIGQLKNGEAYIEIDPTFAEVIRVDNNHPLLVYIQPAGYCKGGVYTVVDGKKGFRVIQQDGNDSDAPFFWRIVAKRKGHADKRFEPAPSECVSW